MTPVHNDSLDIDLKRWPSETNKNALHVGLKFFGVWGRERLPAAAV